MFLFFFDISLARVYSRTLYEVSRTFLRALEALCHISIELIIGKS